MLPGSIFVRATSRMTHPAPSAARCCLSPVGCSWNRPPKLLVAWLCCSLFRPSRSVLRRSSVSLWIATFAVKFSSALAGLWSLLLLG